MELNFNEVSKVPCINCGWSCRRGQCPLAIYIDGPRSGPCRNLTEVDDIFKCGLVLNEKNPVKRASIEELILANKGCTHKFGPHPVSLIKNLFKNGYSFSKDQLIEIKNSLLAEMNSMLEQTAGEESIRIAMKELDQFIQKEID